MRQEPWAKDQGGSQEVTGVPKAETGKWGDPRMAGEDGSPGKAASAGGSGSRTRTPAHL